MCGCNDQGNLRNHPKILEQKFVLWFVCKKNLCVSFNKEGYFESQRI